MRRLKQTYRQSLAQHEEIQRQLRAGRDNLITACDSCNLSKHAKTASEWLQ